MNRPAIVHQHPTPEQLAAWIDQVPDALTREEARSITAHLALCPHCLAWLGGTLETMQEIARALPANRQN